MLVRESIDFVRGRDSKEALNLGIEVRIEQWMLDNDLNSRYEIRHHVSGRVGIDYYGVLIFEDNFQGLPDYIKFDAGTGLNISNNKNLIEFPDGLPLVLKSVSHGHVYADNNNLKSFKNFPKTVPGNLDVRWNPELNSLEGFPKMIGGDLNVWSTPLARIGSESLKRELRKIGCTVNGEITT